jgi:hypothetical protein
MERRMTEEQITKAILNWLEASGWKIICFDFPQSGTGVSLHPNEDIRETKNKGAIIPDIVAIKDKKVIFFENKDRFVLSDFDKVAELRTTTDYSASIKKLLNGLTYSNIFYGVGLPLTEYTEAKTAESKSKIDFAVFVSEDKSVAVKFQKLLIFV